MLRTVFFVALFACVFGQRLSNAAEEFRDTFILVTMLNHTVRSGLTPGVNRTALLDMLDYVIGSNF